VIIKILDNYILFINPDKFLQGITPEILQTDNYIPVHHNKLLAEAFYLHDDIEKFGTGFVHIRKHLKKHNATSLQTKENQAFIYTIIGKKLWGGKKHRNFKIYQKKSPHQSSGTGMKNRFQYPGDRMKYSEIKNRQLIFRQWPDKGGY